MEKNLANEIDTSNLSTDRSTNNQPIDSKVNKNADGNEKKVSPADITFLAKLFNSKLIQSSHVTMRQKSPNSPLHSVKTFEELRLRKELLRGVYGLGFKSPSKIQETVLPILLAEPPQNIVVQSQTGTGKTAAFILAMLSRVDPHQRHPQVLCLSPTPELAFQTGNVVKQMARYCPDIKIRYAVKGERLETGEKLSEQIVIGTPGTVFYWVVLKVLDLRKIRVFVLDEADLMIDIRGHRGDCISIHKRLPADDCQMMLFSATYDPAIMELAEAINYNPVVVRLPREEEILINIKQYFVKCENKEDKYAALSNIYGAITVGKAMIFCNTRKSASRLYSKMHKDGLAVALLAGDPTLEQRTGIFDGFRNGIKNVLITTNVLARGIDVEGVVVVVNFDVTVDSEGRPDFDTYLRRIGRTGRFGKPGIAINMVDGEQNMALLKEIKEHFGCRILQIAWKN